MCNDPRSVLLLIDAAAFERGDRLTAEGFLELAGRIDRRCPDTEARRALDELTREGRLRTLTDRPPLGLIPPWRVNHKERRYEAWDN